jgi:hypothetical protein
MRFAAGWALMLTLGAGSARAAEPSASESCRGPNIVLEPPLSHHRSWRAAAGDTRRRVAELTDVDTCTELDVEQADGAVHVRASVADGRSVVRELSGPSELEPTVVALLVLPPVDRTEAPGAGTENADASAAVAAASAANPSVVPAPVKPPAAKPTSVTSAHDQRDQAEGARTLAGSQAPRAFELTLAGSGRAAGYLTGPGASALIDWRFGRWLFGANVHAEQATGPSTAGRFSAVRTASIGAWFGRRLVARPFYLDAGLELPIVAVSVNQWTSQETVTTPVTTGTGSDDAGEVGESDDPTSMTTTTSSTRTSTQTTPPSADLRAGALLRGVVPFAGGFGAMLAADAEHSLGLLKPPKLTGQPAPLGWNFGLSLGVFWSTR